MMLSPTAREELLDLMADYENDSFGFFEEYANHGICLSCGELTDSVEPDAEGYHCDACHLNQVAGLEHALLYLL